MKCNTVETDLPFQCVKVMRETHEDFLLSLSTSRHNLEAEERSQLLAELVEAITGHVHEVSTFLPTSIFYTKFLFPLHCLPPPPSPSYFSWL